MRRAKCPNWLKGGFAGMAIPVISLLLTGSCMFAAPGNYSCELPLLPLMPFYFMFSDWNHPPLWLQVIIVASIGIIAWFIIGSLLALIGGFLESRQKGK